MLIWTIFAARGLGYSASQGSNTSSTDQVEAFDLPPNCQVPTVPPVADFSHVVMSACSGTTEFTDLSTMIPESWSWNFGDGTTDTLQNPVHTYTSNGVYSVVLVVSNIIGSDSMTYDVTITLPPSPTSSDEAICENEAATFTATGTGSIIWYDSTGTVALDTAGSYTTPVLAQTTTYMVQNAILPSPLFNTPVDGSFGGGGYHNQGVVFTLNFTAYTPFTLVSVWVDANSTGTKTISIWDNIDGAGTVVDQVVVNITATGPQRITLNLDIPAAGTYSIGGSNMDMYRNNNSVAYPYSLAGVVDIISSSAGASQNFYYYYYNWEVQEGICFSEKIPVVANVNVVDVNPTATNAVCTGTNGTIMATPSGGAFPYNYLWSTGNTDASVASLPAAAYSVTVTDDIGCVGIEAVTVGTTNLTLTSNSSASDITCVSSGSATASPSNGTSPYTYLWSNGATDATANSLAAATYTVTVTDGNGCEGTNSATVADNSLVITSTTSSLAMNCSVAGSATVVATNGAGPHTYLWSNGATDATVNSLATATYTVTVTDGNGCEGTNSATVADNSLVITSTTSSVATNCSVAGSATVVATNGAGPHTYLWSNGATDATVNSLATATYTVTVTDGNGCEGTNSATVADNSLVITSTTSSVATNCSVAGSATVVATNGAGPHTYLWSNGATDATVNSLAAATYTVTVTDGNGCEGTNSVAVADNSITITGTTNSTDASCGLSNGSATASPTNGTGALTYLWSNGGTDATINNLSSGNYIVTVTDVNNCTGILNVTVNNSNGPTATSSAINVLCHGDATGSGSVSASGGAGGFTYLWSNGATDMMVTGLVAGVYDVTVTDANSCTAFQTVIITEPSVLGATSSVTNVSTPGGSDGAIDLVVTGGTPGPTYSFNWSNGGTTEDLNSLVAGMYYVTITDAAGCSYMDSVFVQDGATQINSIGLALFVDLYPNPTNSTAVLDFGLAEEHAVQIRVVDVLGQVMQENYYTNTKSLKYTIDVHDYPSAVYFVQLVVDNEIVTKRLIVRRY